MSDVILSAESLQEIAKTVKGIVHLMAEIANSKEDIKEAIAQLREKVDMPATEITNIAKSVYDSGFVSKKRGELDSLEDMLEALEGKL